MVNVTDGTNVNVGFGFFKLNLCHFSNLLIKNIFYFSILVYLIGFAGQKL